MTTLALSACMAALSDELSRLAAATERMHALLDGEAPAPRDGEYLRAAQSIDHTQQVLADLSGLASRMAAQIPADWRLGTDPILAPLRLAELRGRLHPAQGFSAAPAPAGECELF